MIVNVRTSNRRKRKAAMRDWRAFLNGREITNQCWYADDRRGIARVFLHDYDGRCYVDARGEVAEAEWRGRVRLQRKAA